VRIGLQVRNFGESFLGGVFLVADTKAARQAVQKMTKALLESKNRQVAENGRDQEAGEINPKTGFWTDRNKWSKPGRWLIVFERTAPDAVTASLPDHDAAKKIAGSINAARQIHMGLSTRVVAAVKDGDAYALHEDFEWLLLFLFPDLPVSVEKKVATSGDTASFDPATGDLRIKDLEQPYIAAQLFKIASNPAAFGSGTNQISYDEATAALAEFINIKPVNPPPLIVNGAHTLGAVEKAKDEQP
jgi:hypothetical protein